MEFIAHRVNTIVELKNIPHDCGVEIDLRDSGKDLIISHEPFSEGELFEDYLKQYSHGTMIVNIKSEGIEPRALELLNKYKTEKWFFLDSSFPMIYKLSSAGEQRLAVRISEYETIDTALEMKGRVMWAWIDCFSKFPLNENMVGQLKSAGIRTCLVSPELQGRQNDVKGFRDDLLERGFKFDAVCSKIHNINIWKSL